MGQAPQQRLITGEITYIIGTTDSEFWILDRNVGILATFFTTLGAISLENLVQSTLREWGSTRRYEIEGGIHPWLENPEVELEDRGCSMALVVRARGHDRYGRLGGASQGVARRDGRSSGNSSP
jgi:hypothetical protein